MKRLVIVLLLIVLLTGCNEVEEVPMVTETNSIEVTTEPTPTPTPTTTITVEALENEPIFYLSDYERWVAECIVMGEAGSESYAGKVLVSQCLLNACLKDDLQPSEVRVVYKYSGWCEDVTQEVEEAVAAVFDDGYKITEENILWFYAPKYSAGKFHETQRYVLTEGGHKFFAPWEE